MSRREDIVAKIYDLLKSQRSVKLGVVQRDPIVPEELPRTGFPAVNIEAATEERELLAGGLQEVLLEVELVLTVNGKERDKQRNILADSLETTLLNNSDLKALVTDIRVTRLENIENGEASPYASLRMVLETRYCLTI